MIHAKDLMIGDWVVSRKWIAKPFKLISLLERKGDYVYGRTAENSIVGPFFVESLDPISLTPEILEKNGFEFGYTASEEDFCSAVGCGYPEEKGWCYDEGAGEIKIIFPNETDGGIIRLDDQCADKHLELIFVNPIMVHELQHALKLCKIEKEIKL